MANLNYCFLGRSLGSNHIIQFETPVYTSEKATRQIAGVLYYAHTKELFIKFNFISMPNPYSYTRSMRYKQCSRNSKQVLLALA